MEATTKRKRRGEFLSNYDTSDTYLKRANSSKGQPGLLEGHNSLGQPVLIRRWLRASGSDDDGLLDIWREELRALHRLSGTPGSEKYIGRLVDAGTDGDAFYIVLSVGQRRPLAVLMERQKSGVGRWIKSPALRSNRAILWRNMINIARGLNILHSQGHIHCNLDEWSILCSGNEEIDFQLTGFEWSLRLSAGGKNTNSFVADAPLSFIDDWRNFAEVIVRVLGVDFKKIENLKIPPNKVSERLTAEEAFFLRSLLKPTGEIVVDGEYVLKNLVSICSALEVDAAIDDAQNYLILNLGEASRLSASIREASDLTIENRDLKDQLDFVAEDLTGSPRLILVKGTPNNYIVLRGKKLVYFLRPYRFNNNSVATWEYVFCENAVSSATWGGHILNSLNLNENSISVMTMGDARRRLRNLRGRTLSWINHKDELEGDFTQILTREERSFQALALLHLIELSLSVADVFSVRVTVSDIDTENDEEVLTLTLEPNEDRNNLAKALGLRSSLERLRALVEKEAISDDEGWLLTTESRLGKRSASDLELHFESTEYSSGAYSFKFRAVSQNISPPSNGFLVPGGFKGRVSQFYRRANALSELREHSELLKMLADPFGRIVESHETYVGLEGEPSGLDPDKRKAMSELISTLPLYLVQGPPGVGKTFLVKDLVEQRLGLESGARLLLTAQSHHAVDHLMTEIQDGLDSVAPNVLAIRCGEPDKRGLACEIDIETQRQNLVDKLAKSKLAASTSQRLQDKLGHFSATTKQKKSQDKAVKADRRALNDLVMRSANLVYATTNSKELEYQVLDKGRFDWAIIEEAGKATGSELIMPLLLSHRRLLIGDHKQLPPFGADTLSKLLADPVSLKEVSTIALSLIERSLVEMIDQSMKDVFVAEDSAGIVSFTELCVEASRMLTLFESVVESEKIRHNKGKTKRKSIATVLTVQHRMHPKIADMVSRCFYEGKIATFAPVSEKFASEKCPVKLKNASETSRASIIIVNMPYQQSTKGKRNVEKHPRYTNEEEASAVINIIKNLEVDDNASKQPSLAVLSPYSRQVQLINKKLQHDEQTQNKLKEFRAVAKDSAWVNTVDSFQGNEADTVIVSFVRNNHHGTFRRALGFLSDPRRMNVLLSRAKWKLIIVTSLEFIDTVVNPLGLGSDEDADFLKSFRAVLDEYVQTGDAIILNQELALESGHE